jgi:CitB family two-component system response regulator CitT
MTEKQYAVMVVEDEELLLNAIAKKLDLNGFKVVSCKSGGQAIDYLKNMDQKPDAIWLDYYLKDMNGLTFMNALKELSGGLNIPIMVVSNSASDEKVHGMLALGAKKYMLKAQYRLDDLVQSLRHIIAESLVL